MREKIPQEFFLMYLLYQRTCEIEKSFLNCWFLHIRQTVLSSIQQIALFVQIFRVLSICRKKRKVRNWPLYNRCNESFRLYYIVEVLSRKKIRICAWNSSYIELLFLFVNFKICINRNALTKIEMNHRDLKISTFNGCKKKKIVLFLFFAYSDAILIY